MSCETKGARERSQGVGLVVDDEQMSFLHIVFDVQTSASADGTDPLQTGSLSHPRAR
jgi:hypothetical protein